MRFEAVSRICWYTALGFCPLFATCCNGAAGCNDGPFTVSRLRLVCPPKLGRSEAWRLKGGAPDASMEKGLCFEPVSTADKGGTAGAPSNGAGLRTWRLSVDLVCRPIWLIETESLLRDRSRRDGEIGTGSPSVDRDDGVYAADSRLLCPCEETLGCDRCERNETERRISFTLFDMDKMLLSRLCPWP